MKFNIDTSKLDNIFLPRFVEHCEIIDIPAGSTPKTITVQPPGGDGARQPAIWNGNPPGLTAGDFVTIRLTSELTYRVVDLEATPSFGIWPAEGEIKLNGVLYSTLQDAHDAASNGDVILIGPGSYAGLAGTKAILFVGSGKDYTTITDSTSPTVGWSGLLSTEPTFVDCGFACSNSGTNVTVFDNQATGANIQLIRCKISISSGTNRKGFHNNGATTAARLVDTDITASSGGTTAYAVYNEGGIYLEGYGQYSGANADVYTSNTAELRGIQLANGGLEIAGSGSWVGRYIDPDGNIIEKRVIEAADYDYQLFDASNASGFASHFRDNDSSYPDGWGEADAASATDTNTRYSYWRIAGTSSDTSYRYRKQSILDLENDTAFPNVLWGPIFLRDGQFSADVDYYYGMHANNSGTPNLNVFSRIHIWWDSANSLWKIQGEEKDGTTQHDSGWATLDQNPLIPLWLRVKVTNAAAKTTRQAYGNTNDPALQRVLQTQAPSSAPTWGTFWVVADQTRGAGITDVVFIGAIDYKDANA